MQRSCDECYHMAETHNMHYRDITLNEQWCSDITSTQLSLQLDESDNHITVNDDVVLNKSLKMTSQT